MLAPGTNKTPKVKRVFQAWLVHLEGISSDPDPATEIPQNSVPSPSDLQRFQQVVKMGHKLSYDKF